MAFPQMKESLVSYTPLDTQAILTNRDRFERAVTLIERALDFLTVSLSVLASYLICETLHVGRVFHYSRNHLLFFSVVFACLYLLLLDRAGAYASASSLLKIRETERVLEVSATAFGLLLAGAYMIGLPVPHSALVVAVATVPIALSCEKQMMFYFVRFLHARGYGVQSVIIYGAGSTGRRIFSALLRSPKLGLRPVAIVDDNHELDGRHIYESSYRRQHSLRVTSGPITQDLIASFNAGLVLIGIPSIDRMHLDQTAREAFSVGCAVAFVPQLSYRDDTAAGYSDIDGVVVASLTPPKSKAFYERTKRLFDFGVALVALMLAAPVGLIIVLLIVFDSPGPVFFHQKRIGRNGTSFKMYKFRSMFVNAPKYGFHPADSFDPRVTRIGRWLRRTSIDELPQLFNVLRGEMSLVGPRPEMPFIVDGYSSEHRQRLSVKPGITGLWQLSADRKFMIHENIQYDLYYIHHRSFFLDMALLLHTAMFAMRGV